MRRITIAATLVTALATAGCGLILGPGGPPDNEAVGPRFELGPIPRFDAGGDDVTDPGSKLIWFRTADGYCTELESGSGCSSGGPGGGLPQPGERFSFGGLEDGSQTCIESVTSRDLVAIDVLVEGRGYPLTPLPGSEAIPVNIFAACWEGDVAFDRIMAKGTTADGREVRAF